MIDGDHAGVHEADLSFPGGYARKDKTIDKDGESLAARDRADHVRRLPSLAKNLSDIRMGGAIDVPHVVRPSR